MNISRNSLLSPGRAGPEQQIWLAILRLQRKTRLLSVLHGLKPELAGPSLSYTDGLLLHILESVPDRNVRELAEMLNLERSWVSRLVTSLEDRHLVKSTVPENDKRSKTLRITKKGRDGLSALNAFRKIIMHETLRDLSDKQVELLADGFRALADGLKASNYVASSAAHRVDAEMARVSWAVGVLGDNFMQSGLNVTQYQVMYSLFVLRERAVSATELHEALPFDMSTISRTLAGFEKAKLISRDESPFDKRAMAVQLTARGKARWEQMLENARERLAAALSDIPAGTQKSFLETLEAATAAMPRRTRGGTERVEVRELGSAELTPEIERLLRARNRVDAQDRGGAKLSIERYAVLQNGSLRGVAELSRSRSDGKLGSFLFNGEDISPKDCLSFIRACLDK